MPDNLIRRLEHEAETEWDKLAHRHGDSQRQSRPAAQSPVTIKDVPVQPERTTMSNLLTRIEGDVKTDLTEGLDYVGQLVGRLQSIAPSVISTAEALSGTTAGKLVEAAAGAVLPPEAETFLTGIVKDVVARYSTPAASTTAATSGSTTTATTAAPAAAASTAATAPAAAPAAPAAPQAPAPLTK